MQKIRISFWISVWAAIISLICLVVFLQILMAQSQKRITSDPPHMPVAIVFGASVLRNGKPSDILKDRLLTAYDLYHQKKVEKILISGDGRHQGYNEVDAMQSYLMQLGIEQNDLLVDRKGNDTFLTIQHAKNDFGVSNAILVTQNYHLYRALFLANALGMDAYGVASDKHIYQKILTFSAREIFANVKALWDVSLYKAQKIRLF